MGIREVAFGSEDYKALLRIREEVLRKPIGMQLREKDIALDNEEHHIAAFDGDKPIGCVLLRPINKDIIQLRQMAVTNAYQGKGIGAELATFAEVTAIKMGYKTIETRARKSAQGFYQKLGYIFLSEADPLENLHIVKMSKPL